MAFPPPPTTSIDWENLGFRVREVNGHVECRYSPLIGKWSAPAFIRSPMIPIHGMAPALNYGQQAYEGMKAFRSPHNTITIFRPNKNASRIAHAAEIVSIPAVPESLFLDCVHAAVSLNAEFVPPHETGAAMYIRPLVFGSSPQLGLHPPEEYMFCVFVMPTAVYHGVEPIKAVVLEEFDRAAPYGTGHAKVGGNYAPVLKWSEKALKEGYGITLHLDSKTRSEIDEFSTSGFIGVERNGDDIKLVVPDSKNCLQSVTSGSILDIAKSLGWKIEARSIKYQQLHDFSEVMAAGTAAALVPIRSITLASANQTITYLPPDQKEPGPVHQKLLATYKAIQLGKTEDKFGWNSKVEKVDMRSFETGEEMGVSRKVEWKSKGKRQGEGTNATNEEVDALNG